MGFNLPLLNRRRRRFSGSGPTIPAFALTVLSGTPAITVDGAYVVAPPSAPAMPA